MPANPPNQNAQSIDTLVLASPPYKSYALLRGLLSPAPSSRVGSISREWHVMGMAPHCTVTLSEPARGKKFLLVPRRDLPRSLPKFLGCSSLWVGVCALEETLFNMEYLLIQLCLHRQCLEGNSCIYYISRSSKVRSRVTRLRNIANTHILQQFFVTNPWTNPPWTWYLTRVPETSPHCNLLINERSQTSG